MTPESRQKLRSLLVQNESYRQFPYTDTTGHLTVGIGRNLSNRGISQNEAFTLLDDDILYFISKLDSLFSFYSSIDDIRQIVLVDICFNVGINGLLKFKNMLGFLEKKDWENAANEILNSNAAKENVNRYKQLASIMLTGEI